jgi:hypothetical protein
VTRWTTSPSFRSRRNSLFLTCGTLYPCRIYLTKKHIFARLNQFRRLRVRQEKRADIHKAFLSLDALDLLEAPAGAITLIIESIRNEPARHFLGTSICWSVRAEIRHLPACLSKNSG